MATAARRGWRKTRRPSRTRSSERRSPSASECSRAEREIAERGSSTGASSTSHQRGERHERRDEQRPVVAVQERDAGEHRRPEQRQREQVQQRLGDHRAEHHGQRLARAAEAARDDQRTRGLTQASRQRGGHQHADERPLQRVSPSRAAARWERR